ncbi:MAG: CBS domain-containing protein [Candidatus Aenigmarchaeota archaeon]|nr:CBS domain-containing protein [Candidatus Aenigmarchaeota archaeon]
MLAEERKISEIMSKPVIVIEEDKTIQGAAFILREHNIRGLVVVRGHDAQGILTDRDIVAKVVAENLDPRNVAVKDIMVPKIITAKFDELINDVAKKMCANKVGRIPIVDDEGTIVGVVTETDITKLYPAMIDVLYERTNIEEAPIVPEKELMQGCCEECENICDDLIELDGRWLCRSCSEKSDNSETR